MIDFFFLAIEIIFIILIIFLFPLPTNISFFSKYITCISALLIANIYQKYNLKHLQILYYQILPMFPISTCIVCKVSNSKVLLMIKWDHELNQGGVALQWWQETVEEATQYFRYLHKWDDSAWDDFYLCSEVKDFLRALHFMSSRKSIHMIYKKIRCLLVLKGLTGIFFFFFYICWLFLSFTVSSSPFRQAANKFQVFLPLAPTQGKLHPCPTP